jgi:hypothetical protein
VEPVFDPEKDKWFDLDLVDGRVSLQERPFVRLGEVGNWLTSDAFDLKEPRSREGEEAVRAAQEAMRARSPLPAQIEAADKLMRAAGLPDIDPMWVRWDYFVTQSKRAKAEKA